MRKIETGQREESGPSGESTEEREKEEGGGGASSRATNETQVLRRRPRPRGQEEPGSESEEEGEKYGDDEEDKEGEVEGYSGDYSKAVWQALLSGIVVQLVWIGAIRVFSRSGLCMM